MDNGYKGGGEILEYIKALKDDVNGGLRYMNTPLMLQLFLITVIKIVICIMVVYTGVSVCRLILKARGKKGYRAIDRELGSIHRSRAIAVRRNSMFEFIVAISELNKHTPFAISSAYNTELSYILSRAGVRMPGNDRDMTGEQFIALIRLAQVIGCIIAIVIGATVNILFGALLVFAISFLGNLIPLTIVEGIARKKDREIEEEFFDMYIMIHYSLLSKSNNPISAIIKTYGKVTESEEVARFTESCVYTFDTYGEYVGCQRIMEKYKELPSVAKLMRIIKQVNEGDDVTIELQGFREELLNKRIYMMEQSSAKLINQVRASINTLMPVLFQAILSAMSIYLEDMTALSSLF